MWNRSLLNSVTSVDGIVTFLENEIVKFPAEFTLEIIISIGGSGTMSLGFHTAAVDEEAIFISFVAARVNMMLMFKGVTLPIACVIPSEKTGKTVNAF